jgi:hypothetical protein
MPLEMMTSIDAHTVKNARQRKGKRVELHPRNRRFLVDTSDFLAVIGRKYFSEIFKSTVAGF